MNIEGYQNYLKSINKWDSFTGNEIQNLLAFENDLNIDLDDYIPYDGDYSVVVRLNELMTDTMRFNEPLQFAINRYMVYKLEESES